MLGKTIWVNISEIESARSACFSQIIDYNQSNPIYVFHTINRLIKVNAYITLAVLRDQLCNFLYLFNSKIDNVHKYIHATPVSSSPLCLPKFLWHTFFQIFLKFTLRCLVRRYHKSHHLHTRSHPNKLISIFVSGYSQY